MMGRESTLGFSMMRCVASHISSLRARARGSEELNVVFFSLAFARFQQSVPSRYDPSGQILRSLIHDIIDLYEINRKECAGILLDLPNWCREGTFKRKEQEGDQQDEQKTGRSEWVLENMVVEVRPSSL